MRTWAISAGLSLMAACSSIEVDPSVVPLEGMRESHRERVVHILADVAAVVPLETSEVKSRLEIYDFLLDEMPFTAGVVRRLGRGTWRIDREPAEPDPSAFIVEEPGGYRLRFDLVRKEPTRRFYVTRGSFNMGFLPPLEGSTLISMTMVPEGEAVRTDAVVYVRVETPFYSTLAKGFRGIVESKVRAKAGFFIQAARWVAEEAAARPDWLVEQVEGAEEVDQEVLAEFRKRFLR